MPKLNYIVNADRPAGYGKTPPPPKEWKGKELVLGRPLIRFHGYWVELDGAKTVIAHAEVYDGTDEQCECGDCIETRELKEAGNCL